MKKQVTGWHFAGKTLRDGRPLPKKGETLKHDGEVIPCKSGYHASKLATDALRYAPGAMVARVRLSGTVVPHENNKHAASRRTTLTDYVDATDVLREFARLCALRAARVHAATAMEKAGLIEHAKSLRALPDNATPSALCCVLSSAARAAASASYSAPDWAASWAKDSAIDSADENVTKGAANSSSASASASVCWFFEKKIHAAMLESMLRKLLK